MIHYSLVGGHYTRTGRRARHLCHLLSVDKPPSTKDIQSLLGLLSAQRGGATYRNLEGEHPPSQSLQVCQLSANGGSRSTLLFNSR